jgi:hypothetical protein
VIRGKDAAAFTKFLRSILFISSLDPINFEIILGFKLTVRQTDPIIDCNAVEPDKLAGKRFPVIRIRYAA